ncbi:DoxX family protein [Undibacterium jejuense]|uniref:DoxX family protein n=1 Tax=Undibacterium jejuense TaxID=1344949 RepID=A0A923HF65_9BURK|nr:DoxX family protein [Undibacterium jejuense]MBC3863422.1 DoxX family protein [Undibacterium jejuense]
MASLTSFWRRLYSKDTEHVHDLGLLYLRVCGALLLLYVHGLPKILHFSDELQRIEDPMHLGKGFSLCFSIFAEVICPLLIIAGVFVRVAALSVVCLLVVAMFLVHPDWSFAEGQFGWLFMIIFGTVLIAGAGRFSVDVKKL